MQRKEWILKPPVPLEVVDGLEVDLSIPRSLCTLLGQRGVSTFEEARRFFRPSYDHTHNPMLMKNMGAAVRRINDAINKGEKIMVYGDYDVDGTTAVAMMFSFLTTCMIR